MTEGSTTGIGLAVIVAAVLASCKRGPARASPAGRIDPMLDGRDAISATE